MGSDARRRFREAFEPGRSSDIRAVRDMEFPSPTGAPAYPPPLTGGPGIAPRGPDAQQAILARLLYPPRIEKINASRDFNVQDFQMILPGVVGATVTSAALRFAVPQSQVGWLQQFGLYVLTPTANTRVRWSVRINEGPVAGFDNLENPPGIANFIFLGTDDMRIRIPDAAIVDVLITNLGGTAETVGGSLAGWYHPEVAERRAWDLDL